VCNLNNVEDAYRNSTKERLKTGLNTILRIYLSHDLDVQDFMLLFESIDRLYKFQFCFVELDKYLSNVPKSPSDPFYNVGERYNASIIHEINHIIRYEKAFPVDQVGLSVLLLQVEGVIPFFRFDLPLVVRTEHPSPGFTDILGIGEVLKQLQSFISYYLPNKADRERAEILRQEKIEKQIKNLKAVGFSNIEIREMLLKSNEKELQLEKLIAANKITSAEIKE
jgi:hypothetical protein